MFVTAHTPYLLLACVLFVRGVGLGAAIQPSVAAAYQLIDSAQVPRATAALNTLRQIGGSIGTTVLAVMLQREAATSLSSLDSAGGLLTPLPNTERVRISGAIANAFGHTFFWALLIALLTLIPAVLLIHAERHPRRHWVTEGPAEVSQGRFSEPAATATTASFGRATGCQQRQRTSHDRRGSEH
jgi:hypothetical protein